MAMDAIIRRASIRKYTSEPIPESAVRKILEAAMSAPSARNERPWQFLVITDPDLLTMLADMSPYAKMAQHAPLAVLVCADLKRELSEGFWVQDCAAATENILIEVEEQGLGAVWLGIYPREVRVEYVRNVFHLPAQIIPFALVPIGHPAEEKKGPSRYDASRIHYNRW